VSDEAAKGKDKPELVFSDLPIGRTFRPLAYPVTKGLVREYMETVGDHHPLYLDERRANEGPLEAPIAPPGLAAIYARLSYLQDHAMPSGGVLAKQEFEFTGPIRVGDTLRVGAKVIESYLDEKERKRVTFLIEAENQKGDPISTVRLFAIWPK
jgi:acyl dehydratase